MVTNNLYAALLRAAGSATSRKVAGECVKKLDPFMERSGGWGLACLQLQSHGAAVCFGRILALHGC